MQRRTLEPCGCTCSSDFGRDRRDGEVRQTGKRAATDRRIVELLVRQIMEEIVQVGLVPQARAQRIDGQIVEVRAYSTNYGAHCRRVFGEDR